MRFGPPLPVGVAGVREALDVALERACPSLAAELNETLPAGLRIRRALVVGVQAPPSIDQFVTRRVYRVVLPPPAAGGPSAEALSGRIDAFQASDSWLAVRRRAKGDVEIDVRKLVPDGGLTVEPLETADGAPETALRVELTRDQSGANLPIQEFLNSLLGDSLEEPRWARYARIHCLGRDAAGHWLSPLGEIAGIRRRVWMRCRIHA
jgi:hypothetical protein